MALVQIAGQNYQVSPSGRVTDSSNNVVTNANLIATARAQAASPRLNRRLNTDSLAVGANTGILQAVEDAKRSRGFSRKPKYIGMDQGLSSVLDPYVRDPKSSAASNIASFLGRGFGRGTGEVLDVIGEGLGVAGEEITDFFTKPVGSGVEYDVLYNTPEGVDLANISGSGVGRPVIGSLNPRAVLTPEGSTGSKPIPTLANLMGTGEEEQFYGDGQSELVDLFSSFGVPDAIRDGQPSVATDTVKDVIESDVAKPKSEPEETKLKNLMGEESDLQFAGAEQQGADTGEINAGSGTTTDGGKSGEQINRDLYQGLLDQSLKSYNEAIGMAPPKAQTMQQYKDEFSKATGIDISGDPDNKAALTAFGLALMQNKAGKGFNVGRMLSEVGAAGEKALPLMEQARREAREAQVAAGKYALTEGKTATANRQKFLVDQAKYLRDRRDTILGAQVTRINEIEDREDKQAAESLLKDAKFKYDYEIDLLKLEKEMGEDQFKTTDTKDRTPLANKPNLKITYAKSEKDGRPRFLYPAEDAAAFGTALADVKEGTSSLDFMRDQLRSVKDLPGGINLQKAKEIGQAFTASFGYKMNEVPQFDKDGKYIGTKAADKPLANLDAVRDRVISQFKRFLTQETGNGVSNVDIQKVEKLLGKIDFFGDPNVALERIEEAKKIFNASESKILTIMEGFENQDRYLSPEEYKLTRQAISKAIAKSYKLGSGAGDVFDFTEDDQGIKTYKLF
tara:strand:+ start:442 stop:2649 length:2208 start_codon:yes stop_codon:yes gene_type:complete